MDLSSKRITKLLQRCGEGDSCYGCPFQKENGCTDRLMRIAAEKMAEMETQIPPMEHGELIDRKQLLDEILELAKGSRVLAGWGNLRLLYTLVNTAPTIIPMTPREKKEAPAK